MDPQVFTFLEELCVSDLLTHKYSCNKKKKKNKVKCFGGFTVFLGAKWTCDILCFLHVRLITDWDQA